MGVVGLEHRGAGGGGSLNDRIASVVGPLEDHGAAVAASPGNTGGLVVERPPRAAPTRLLAVQAACFGGPDVLVPVERSAPRAGAGEVLIAVDVSDVLLADTWIRRGERGARLVLDPPYVPGCGVVGEVVSVGRGVDPALVGLRVAAHSGRSGGYADVVAVAAEQAVPVPTGLDPATAAALLHDGPAALAVAAQVRIRPGDRVLVTAGAGGVGALLVQLAHAAGARVTALARGRTKLDLVRTLGADTVLDSSDARWAGAVLRATQGRGVDVVLDGVGGRVGRLALDVTARGGRLMTYGAASGDPTDIDPDSALRRGVRLLCAGDLHPGHDDVVTATAHALEAGAMGRLRPFIGQTFPLRRAADAHAAMESGRTIGKTLLLSDEAS